MSGSTAMAPVVSGTGATNVIPSSLEAQFNFRFSTEHNPESLMQGFEKFFEGEDIKFEVSWLLGGLPFLTQKGKLIESCQNAVQNQFGYVPKLETGGGTSDARFIAPLGTEVIELGVRGESLHKVDEFVRVEELEPLAKLYQDIISRIL